MRLRTRLSESALLTDGEKEAIVITWRVSSSNLTHARGASDESSSGSFYVVTPSREVADESRRSLPGLTSVDHSTQGDTARRKNLT